MPQASIKDRAASPTTALFIDGMMAVSRAMVGGVTRHARIEGQLPHRPVCADFKAVGS